jgi:antitoxin component of RelBE/YafQ-DinJ toxin-antitoxin module
MAFPKTQDDYKKAAENIATNVLNTSTMTTSEGMRLALEQAAAEGMLHMIRELRDENAQFLAEIRNRPDAPGC